MGGRDIPESAYLSDSCPRCGGVLVDCMGDDICEKCSTENWKASDEGGCNLSYVELERAAYKQAWEIEQILGKALGYPKYRDDPENFPSVTDDSVCVGEHVPETLAMEAARRIETLERDGRCVPVDVDCYGFTNLDIYPSPAKAYHPMSGAKFVGYRVVLKPRSSVVTIKLGRGREIRICAWANRINTLGPTCEHELRYQAMLDAADVECRELRKRLAQYENEDLAKKKISALTITDASEELGL